jgi:gas vesicle protein
MMSSGKILLGALAGVAIGAALGILFAPDKGSETRKKIADKSNAYADGLGDRFNEFIEALTEKLEEMQEDAKHLIKNENHDSRTGIRTL